MIIALILVGGWIGSRVSQKFGLPPILGMLIMGIVIKLVLGSMIPNSLKVVEPFFKSLALIVILLRAGLSIDRKTLHKIGLPAILMSFIPCIFEGTALLLLLRYGFGFSMRAAGMAGFMMAAVSPAVVIPAMLNLKQSGLGKKKEVPTLILAGASADDVFAITIFSLFVGLNPESHSTIGNTLLHIPYSILMGIGAGILLGIICAYLLKLYGKKIRATEKTIVLIGLCLVLADLGEIYKFAALLAVMTIGFIILERENAIAKEISSKLSKIWVAAEIVLFVLIGMAIEPKAMSGFVWQGLAIIGFGLFFRSLGVILATAFTRLNRHEKLFCVISYLPKATVQAALGTTALSMGIEFGTEQLALALLAIATTAPLSLFLIKKCGAHLLDRNNEHRGK